MRVVVAHVNNRQAVLERSKVVPTLRKAGYTIVSDLAGGADLYVVVVFLQCGFSSPAGGLCEFVRACGAVELARSEFPACRVAKIVFEHDHNSCQLRDLEAVCAESLGRVVLGAEALI